MSVRTALVLLLAIAVLSFAVGCGGGGGSRPVVTPPPTGGFSNSDFKGTYVFSISGTDAGNAAYAIVGTMTADGSGGNGKGNITGGMIDINDAEFTPVFAVAVNNNGFYSVGTDGRGQATIGIPSASNPFPGHPNLTFDFVLQDSSHGLITEFDGNGSGSGTIDLQPSAVSQSSLAGSYAFSFSGVDSTLVAPFVTVGAFTLNATGGITSGGEDFNDANIAYPNNSLTGQVTLGPSATSTTTLTTTPFSENFDVYAIDSTHLKFIEMDSGPILSGDAFLQTSATIPTGTMAFTMSGFFPFNASTGIPLATGGFLVANTSGASSEDWNSGGTPSTASQAFTATFSSTGSVIPSRFVLTNSTPFVGGAQYAAYPYGNAVLLLEIDNSTTSGTLGIMAGAAYPQSTTTFAQSQGYGLNLTGLNLSNSVEVDDIAEFTATSTGTVTGNVDENFAPGSSPASTLGLSNGTYGSIDSNGRYGVSASAAGTLNGGFALTLYSTDGTVLPFIESDNGGQVATGIVVEQTASGASAAARSHTMFVPQPLFRPHAEKLKQKK
jgi:hypothetical protein